MTRKPSRASYADSIGIAGLSFLTLTVVGLVSSVLTARIYGIGVVGEFAIAAAPGVALWSLSTVREQTALVRILAAEPPHAPGTTGLVLVVLAFSTVITALIALLLAAGTVVLFRGPLDVPELVVPALACLAANTALVNVSWNIDAVLSAYLAARELYWIRLAEALAFVSLAIAGGNVFGTVWALVGATYAAATVALLIRLSVVRRYLRRPGPGEFGAALPRLPDIVRAGLAMTPGTVFTGLRLQAPTWLAMWLLSVATVGALSRAQLVTTRLQVVTARITEILYPTLVARRAAGDREGFNRALVKTLRYVAVAMLGLAAVLGGAGHGVMALFGEPFARYGDVFALLLLCAPLHAVSVVQAHALYVLDRPGVTSWASGCGLAVTVAVGVPATMVMGLAGSGLGLLIGSLADTACKTLALRPHIEPARQDDRCVKRSLGTAAALVAGFAVARLVDASLNSLPGLILAAGSGTAAFACLLLAAGAIDEPDQRRLTRALRRRAALSANHL